MNRKTVLVSILLVALAQPVAADTVEVAAVGLKFVPADITITVGDSVHWTGLSGGFHSVAEVDDPAAMVWNGGFHSAAAASEFTFTFNTPGPFFYICEPHVLADMRGSITVEPLPPPIFGDSDGDGDVDLEDHDDLFDCLAGPDAPPDPTPPMRPAACLDAFDSDGDGDVDLVNFGAFLEAFTGPL